MKSHLDWVSQIQLNESQMKVCTFAFIHKASYTCRTDGGIAFKSRTLKKGLSFELWLTFLIQLCFPIFCVLVQIGHSDSWSKSWIYFSAPIVLCLNLSQFKDGTRKGSFLTTLLWFRNWVNWVFLPLHFKVQRKPNPSVYQWRSCPYM